MSYTHLQRLVRLSDTTPVLSSSRRISLIEATISGEDVRFLYSHGRLGLNVSRFFTERIVEGDLLTLFTQRGFCSLPVGHNSGILEFFGADLHLDFCARGCPTPLSASRRATSLPRRATLQWTPLQKGKAWPFPVTLLSSGSNQALNQCEFAHPLRQEGADRPLRLILHAACGPRSGPHNLVSIHGAPPFAETQSIGCRPVTSNSLCRSCAVPPDWPMGSAGKFPWCAGQRSFESNHKAKGSSVIVHPCSST